MSAAQPAARFERDSSVLLFALSGYLLFIVYGSLVPFNFVPRPLEAAWRDFLDVPYFQLGIESRADWVANGVLYVPLAFLMNAWLQRPRLSVAAQGTRALGVFVICVAVAVGVEFTQEFFPPRTVSMNDLMAETIGSALGIVAWSVWGDALTRLWKKMKRGGMTAIRAAVFLYVLAFLGVSMFPFDFLLSAQELSEKLTSGRFGLLIAPGACGRVPLCFGQLFAETMIVVPLGVLLGMVRGKSAPRAYAMAVWLGLALGLAIETGQLFIAAGLSQGVSLVTRACGMVLGVALHRHARLRWMQALHAYVVPAILLAALPYFLALLWLNGWLSARWVGIEQARENILSVNWLPFYYHYFTTEQAALTSLIVSAAMYLPVGLGYWAWTLRRSYAYSGGAALVPALVAAPLALVLEMGKLFVPGKHPDPTDVLIAAFSAASGYLLAVQVQKWALHVPVAAEPERGPEASPIPGAHQATVTAGLARSSLAALLLVGVAVAVINYPLGPVLPLIALGAYAAVLWRHPRIGLPLVVAMLPWLNLAPWTGWVLLDEFDLLVAVTLAVRLLRPSPEPLDLQLSVGTRWAIALLCLSFLSSALIGLIPLSPLDRNALASYYSSFNSLRTLKGFAWALALLPLVVEELRHPQILERRFMAAMSFGLCGVVAVVIWQRAVFTGLLDFVSDYRITGTFPEMHTGGGFIEAYLAAAIPFTLAWVVLKPSLTRILGGGALFACATYALVVTFARAGYLAYAGGLLIIGIAAIAHWKRDRAWKLSHVAAAAVMLAIGAAIAVPVLTGSFMQSRVAAVREDTATRTQHWAHAAGMVDEDWRSRIFGMGLGTFPLTYLLKNTQGVVSATFRYVRDGENTILRLGSGETLYLDQRISVRAGARYTLTADVRSANDSPPNIQLCEKSALYSFRCKSPELAMKSETEGWKHYEGTLDTDDFGQSRWPLGRPVVISLQSPQEGTLDADNLHLLNAEKTDIIDNGDFTRGGDHWFFSADNHLPWHIKHLWVQVLFEQGWFGIAAVGFAVLLGIVRLASGAWQGNLFSGAVLASLTAFLLCGLFDSTFDAPRLATLFFMLLLTGLCQSAVPGRSPDMVRGKTRRVRSTHSSKRGPGRTSVHGPAS